MCGWVQHAAHKLGIWKLSESVPMSLICSIAGRSVLADCIKRMLASAEHVHLQGSSLCCAGP